MENSQESAHLAEIITCIKETQKPNQESPSKLESLYSSAGELIQNFETNINRCKRYNEAKINRKYEMIIHDLESEVRKLNNKLKMEQDSRSPTKKHIGEILDQLVVYKEENERLKKEVEEYTGMLTELEERCEYQVAAIKKMQNTQSKSVIERLPAIVPHSSVADTIKDFIKDKESQRKLLQNSEKSNLEKFFSSNYSKLWNWSLGNLLEELDKWSEGVKPLKQVDMWRIRSSVARSFSDYLDNSQILIKPASYTKNTRVIEERSLRKKESRFSVFGDRKERSSQLDGSFH